MRCDGCSAVVQTWWVWATLCREGTNSQWAPARERRSVANFYTSWHTVECDGQLAPSPTARAPCLAPLASAVHLLGECSHRDIKSMHIVRHNKAVGLIQDAIASGPLGAATWLWMHVVVTLRLILLLPHASHPDCPQSLHAYATNFDRIFSLLRVCLYAPALRSPPPLLLCPTCSAHAAYTLSKLVTAPIRPRAGCKCTPLKNCNTSALLCATGRWLGAGAIARCGP